MTPVTLININAMQALALRDQLLADGLVQEQDFTWEYHQAEYEHFGPPTKPKQVTFNFADPKLAVFYQLKLSNG